MPDITDVITNLGSGVTWLYSVLGSVWGLITDNALIFVIVTIPVVTGFMYSAIRIFKKLKRR